MFTCLYFSVLRIVDTALNIWEDNDILILTYYREAFDFLREKNLYSLYKKNIIVTKYNFVYNIYKILFV